MTSPFEEGDPQSKICILAEAPSYTEIRMGRPLIGPSGQVFDQCLHSAGILRREVYILNLWEEQVYKDREGKEIRTKHGEVLYTVKSGFTDAGAEYANNTLRRIEGCGANVVIPLGGVALEYMFGDNRIGKWRGSCLLSNITDRKILPTYHPAAVLRGKSIWKYDIASDLSKARGQAQAREYRPPPRSLIVDPSYADVIAYLKDMQKVEKVAFDVEVLNGQISCISFAPSPMESMCIPLVGGEGGHRWTLEQEADIWLDIVPILDSPSIMKINQNIIFDLYMLLRRNNIHWRGPLGDTMIAQHIMFPDFPKGLDYICSIHTDEPYYKDDGKIWQRPWADPIRFWQYNARDSAVAFDAWNVLDPMLDNGYRDTYNDTIELFPALMYMMLRGIRVDRDELGKTKTVVEGKIADLEHSLKEESDYDFNPASPKQCIEYFYIHKGIKPYVHHKTGRPTVDDKALARIVRRYNLTEARLVQELRRLNKLLSTYLEVGIDSDSRLRCMYNPRGTVTGRLSSSGTVFNTGMNMQNLHPEFKGFLVAG